MSKSISLQKKQTNSQRIGIQGERLAETFLGAISGKLDLNVSENFLFIFSPDDTYKQIDFYLHPVKIHQEDDFGTDFDVEVFFKPNKYGGGVSGIHFVCQVKSTSKDKNPKGIKEKDLYFNLNCLALNRPVLYLWQKINKDLSSCEERRVLDITQWAAKKQNHKKLNLVSFVRQQLENYSGKQNTILEALEEKNSNFYKEYESELTDIVGKNTRIDDEIVLIDSSDSVWEDVTNNQNANDWFEGYITYNVRTLYHESTEGIVAKHSHGLYRFANALCVNLAGLAEYRVEYFENLGLRYPYVVFQRENSFLIICLFFLNTMIELQDPTAPYYSIYPDVYLRAPNEKESLSAIKDKYKTEHLSVLYLPTGYFNNAEYELIKKVSSPKPAKISNTIYYHISQVSLDVSYPWKPIIPDKSSIEFAKKALNIQ